MKHIFIVNSISGKGLALKTKTLIVNNANKLGIDYQILETEYQGHAQDLVSKFKKEDDVIIYAVGGDGTIHEVLNGLDDNIPMGIIPCGSGNDFYRFFINTESFDYNKLIIDTINAPITKIDYGIANNKKFINTTSLGIDSDVNAYASKLIRRTFITKRPAYFLSIFKNVVLPKSKKLRIKYDNQECNGNFYIACIMNGKYYGNGVKSAPSALINDGYFDFILASKCNIFYVYLLLSKYLNGKHEDDHHFNIIKAKNIHIESDEMFSIQLDGENSFTNVLDIHIKEKGLSLKVPDHLKNRL